jgi:hypothetical protein
MRSKATHRLTELLTLVLMISPLGLAQTTSGSIAGSVVDAQHAILQNAQVSAKEQQQNFTFSARTDESQPGFKHCF